MGGAGGGTSRNTNLSSVRKSLNSKNVDKKRTFILFSTFTIHSLFQRVAARWRSEVFFPTSLCHSWDLNPHQCSCTGLGPLKDALQTELPHCS